MSEIYKKHPDAELQVWAYHTYRTIPTNIKYDPRALVYYCSHGRCYGHALNDHNCPKNAMHCNLIKQWALISSRMRFYEYANSIPIIYGCPEMTMAQDLRYYLSEGFEGWKEGMYFADAHFTPWKKKALQIHVLI